MNLLEDIKPQYFWDVDFSKLDIQGSKRLIIERVFTLGNINEINLLIGHYGKKEIVSVLENINYLDAKTLNFVSKLFRISKKHFKCYSRKQLMAGYWNF
jgi:hypothetical protein